MEKTKKRTGLIVALVLCLALAAVGGVMAWYASQSSLTNTFAVGNIKPPTTDPDQPEKPLKPEVKPEEGGHQGQVNGNIVEDKWIEGSKLTAGSHVAKNPNIGLAPESDAAYVFAYVKNDLGSGTYFTLNEHWKPVDGQAVKHATGGDQAYESGLFMYVADGAEAAMLQPSVADVWTGELFSEVVADPNASIAGSPTMTVSCYMVAKSNASEVLSAKDATDAAIAWAASQK